MRVQTKKSDRENMIVAVFKSRDASRLLVWKPTHTWDSLGKRPGMKLQGPRPRARIIISRDSHQRLCRAGRAALDRTHGFGESLAPNGPLPSFLIFWANLPLPLMQYHLTGDRAKAQPAERRSSEPTGSSGLRKRRVRHGRCNGAI